MVVDRTGEAVPLRSRAAAGLLRGCAVVSLSEPEILGLSRFVRPGDVCLDIGAGYGMYTHPLAALVGSRGAVHAFEPLPVPYRILDAGRRASGARHVITHNTALGPRAGELDLALPYRFGLPVHGWAYPRSGLRRPGRRISFSSERTLRVRADTVDAVCAAAGVDRVAFMKIDTEGFEMSVLEGAFEVLARDRPALLLEVEDRHLDKYGLSGAEVVGALRSRGYEMRTWRSGRWVPASRADPRTRNHLFTVQGALRP
ncbi:FkbM family methyltransferase [Nocardiopsis sp. CC223A]|uniref:FkbM family methyltransferase n=1 Tax=Nocardiopsis sp. CC223A TaxID=3044051 RepID=UPI00278C814B|nr:FkbM family methyltransferase [Nocardiopsis sp. CC223A]